MRRMIWLLDCSEIDRYGGREGGLLVSEEIC